MHAPVRLASASLVVDIAPELGGRITRVQTRDGLDLIYPLPSSPFSSIHWPKGGIYPLLPYSNRIRDGRLHADGRTYPLPPHPDALPHTLHGVAHTMQWRGETLSDHCVRMRMSYAGAHWPWPFAAEQTVKLDGAALRIELSVRNDGDTPMPAGLGIHPYAAFDQGDVATFAASERWETDSDALPTGVRRLGISAEATSEDPSGSLDATSVKTQARDYLAYLGQWEGTVQVRRAAGTLRLSASSPCTHLVLFAPHATPYLCIEPVTHVADGFNLFEQGISGTGTAVLLPGDTLSAQFEVAWLPSR